MLPTIITSHFCSPTALAAFFGSSLALSTFFGAFFLRLFWCSTNAASTPGTAILARGTAAASTAGGRPDTFTINERSIRRTERG